MGAQLNTEQNETRGLAEAARTQTHRVICSWSFGGGWGLGGSRWCAIALIVSGHGNTE